MSRETHNYRAKPTAHWFTAYSEHSGPCVWPGKETTQADTKFRSGTGHRLQGRRCTEVWRAGAGQPLPPPPSAQQDELTREHVQLAPQSAQPTVFPNASAAISLMAPQPRHPAACLTRGPRTRGRGCSRPPLGPPRVPNAAPGWLWAAHWGPCWVRAQLLAWPRQVASWALEKAVCSQGEHRDPETDQKSNCPLLRGAPELGDRRDQGKAVLASKGHSRALSLWVKEHRSD